jgi:hypothetical protein
LASPIVGVKRFKGKGAFGPSRNRVSYNVSLLNGDDEAVSIRDDAKEARRISIFVPFGDANLWRKDAGESGEAFVCIFIVAAEAEARETFTNFVTKAKENVLHLHESAAKLRRRKRHVCLVLCNTRLSGKLRHALGQHQLNEQTLEGLVEHRLNDNL